MTSRTRHADNVCTGEKREFVQDVDRQLEEAQELVRVALSMTSDGETIYLFFNFYNLFCWFSKSRLGNVLINNEEPVF